MARIPVKLNLRGINEVLRKAQPLVDEIGKDVASDAGPGYRYVSNPHRYTARGHVETADAETAKQDAKTNDLLKSLGRNIK